MKPHISILLGASLLACLLMIGCDDSTAPLSDASKARPNDHLTGLWQHKYQGGVTYYHVGRLGGKAPQGVMRVVTVSHPNGGELRQPSQLIAFCSDLGGNRYLNLAGTTPEQVASIWGEGWKADAVNSYILLKYRVEDDALLLWATDREAKKKAIEGGKIQGEIMGDAVGKRIRFTDTTRDLAQFVAAAGDELFSDEPLRFERVR